MQLGETIATYDVALALRGESGKFEVTCPTGETLHVICKPNHSISNLEWSGGRDSQPFVIRKIAEPVSPEIARTAAASGAIQTPAKTPFLLESEPEDAPHDQVAALPKLDADRVANGEALNFDLLYLESDPQTRQPSARICLDGKAAGQRQFMTTVCTSLNEFDSEIRRLHAQLDDIRSRARKQFYQANTVAASA